jgi:hypothetical protein
VAAIDHAPAVKQPTTDGIGEASHTAQPLQGVSGPRNNTNLARWRRKSRDRSQEGCGKNCIIAYRRRHEAEEIPQHLPYDQWSKADHIEIETVLASLRDTIATSTTPSCMLASYLGRITCIDISVASTTNRDVFPFSTASTSGRSSGHLPSPELPDSDSNFAFSQGSNAGLAVGHGDKRKKKDHEDSRQQDIAVGYKYINPCEDLNGEFSQSEMVMRVPRAVLPWSPCHHPGRPCNSFNGREDHKGVHCSCRRNGTWCEPGCGCPVDCSDRFPGCQCAKEGKDCRLPPEDAKGKGGCPCAEHFRECHVEVCAGHNERKCRLMSLQHGEKVVSL